MRQKISGEKTEWLSRCQKNKIDSFDSSLSTVKHKESDTLTVGVKLSN